MFQKLSHQTNSIHRIQWKTELVEFLNQGFTLIIQSCKPSHMFCFQQRPRHMKHVLLPAPLALSMISNHIDANQPG
ncbi:MAG: hypothetical protein CMI09_05150 [Oceanospirillaceae bacterium]|nr:hypothetical protein [Oceanospirillaceae bacterium]|tara:strand:+ start:282 stop:509 length:228 start_codon:yes stop_codon:yes gene_type:complete